MARSLMILALGLLTGCSGGSVTPSGAIPPATTGADLGVVDTSESSETPTDSVPTVTDDVIRVGLLPDLSGGLALYSTPTVRGQVAFWDQVNADGGIDGRMVELVLFDTGNRDETAREHYATLSVDDGVLMISHVAGSATNAAIAPAAQSDGMLVTPRTWDSNVVADGQTVLGATQCVAAANGVDYLARQVRDRGQQPRLAVFTYPGPYGQDAAHGAKFAAEALGIEVVVDAEARLQPLGDNRALVGELLRSGATMVWIASGPVDLAALLGGAVEGGFDGLWAGNNASFTPGLLSGDLGPALDRFYTQVSPHEIFGTSDSPGMQQLVEVMAESSSDDLIDDGYVRGWVEGMFAAAVIKEASESDDLTRAGVLEAAGQVEVDFEGLSPPQRWSGDAGADAVRATYMYDVDLAAFNDRVTLAEYSALEDRSIAGFGLIPVQGFAPFTSDVAAQLPFDSVCLK